MTTNNGEKALAIPGDLSGPFGKGSSWLKLNSCPNSMPLIACLCSVLHTSVSGVNSASSMYKCKTSFSKANPQGSTFGKGRAFGDHRLGFHRLLCHLLVCDPRK